MTINKSGVGAVVLAAVIAASGTSFLDVAAAQGGRGGQCITAKCHAGMLQAKFVHGPVAVQDCLLCHRQAGKHSFKPAARGADLCYQCHERMEPSHGSACLSCHDPHGSDREFQLKPGVKGNGR